MYILDLCDDFQGGWLVLKCLKFTDKIGKHCLLTINKTE